MAKRGATLWMTQDVVDLFCQARRLGLRTKDCCRHAGISVRTWREWQRHGRAGEEPYAAFIAQVDEADAKGKAAALAMIRAAAPKDWKAAAWILDRCYGYHAKWRVAGSKNNPIRVEHSDAKERLAELFDRIAQRSLGPGPDGGDDDS